MSNPPPLDAATRAELARKAEAATPGPWYASTWGPDVRRHEVFRREPDKRWDHPVTSILRPADAEYIAACTPDVILALLAAVERGEAARLDDAFDTGFRRGFIAGYEHAPQPYTITGVCAISREETRKYFAARAHPEDTTDAK